MFGLSDRIEVHLYHIMLPAGDGKTAEKTKGPSLDIVSTIKRSIVVVKADFLCLAKTLIIAMAMVNRDPKCKSL
jgi:hypothetical protein